MTDKSIILDWVAIFWAQNGLFLSLFLSLGTFKWNSFIYSVWAFNWAWGQSGWISSIFTFMKPISSHYLAILTEQAWSIKWDTVGYTRGQGSIFWTLELSITVQNFIQLACSQSLSLNKYMFFAGWEICLRENCATTLFSLFPAVVIGAHARP